MNLSSKAMARLLGAAALFTGLNAPGAADAADTKFKIFLSMSYIGNDWQAEACGAVALAQKKYDVGANDKAYSLAQTLVQVLRQCGDNLTRENVMKQAASLDITLPLPLPGINIKTGPDDFFPIEREQLGRFDGKSWVLFGKVYGR